MSDNCFCFLFSNDPIFSNDRFLFFTASDNSEMKNQLEIPKDSNLFLIKFEYEENNAKYLIIEDKVNNTSHSCQFDSFTSHFVCYISKNGKPQVNPKSKKRFNWLNIKVNEPNHIKNILDFAFLPHKFNNFYQVLQTSPINSSIEEFWSIIFKFRPNGYFLRKEKYFDFALDFILFYNGNDDEILKSDLFSNFVDIIINELFEMKQYMELAAITFCTKNRKIIPPLEVSHLTRLDPERNIKICETVIIFYGNLFLLWAFNINFDLDLFFTLSNKWMPSKEFKIEDIFDIVEQKLKSNDFSNYALSKYFEFVKLFIHENQISSVEQIISSNQYNLSESAKKQIKISILNLSEDSQNNNHIIPRIDQKDYDYQSNDKDNDNDSVNTNDNVNENEIIQSSSNSDQNYINRINELRGLWFNSIPNSFLYQRKEEKDVYSPPFTFRLYEPPQTSLSGKKVLSTRPNRDVIKSVGNVPKFRSSRPVNRHPLNPS